MGLDKSQTFLKWAGGKRRIVNRLLGFLPPDVGERTYHEPFLGAGSLFLAVRPSRSRLSDLNKDLISTFEHVRDQPSLVSRYLRAHAQEDSEDYYYVVRDKYNSASHYSCAQAARFIYLNRTCFNGVFRVNRSGDFNVPYGLRKKAAHFPDREHLENVSRALQNATLSSLDFTDSLHEASRGDFVYLDPPYPPLNGTSFFRHYTPDRFGERDQRTVFECFSELDRNGCLVLMSNADTPLIRDLYGDFFLSDLSTTRWISCKNQKHAVSELVITNYPPPKEETEGIR